MRINLKDISTADLWMLLDAVEDGSIVSKIDREISRREHLAVYQQQSDFRSDRLPDFDEEYLCKVNQLALEFNVDRLPNFWRSACFDYKNNAKGDFYIGMFGSGKDELDKKWMHNLGYMSLLFQDEKLRSQYEGSFNCVNYLINGLYKEVKGKNIESIDDVFNDMDDREDLVMQRFSDVCEYLWEQRNSVVDSRMSVGNHGLKSNLSKTKKGFSEQQMAVVEAVAFGCSLDELSHENYEGAKRLIFVPQGKIRR